MNVLFIYSVQKSVRRRYPLKGQEDIQMGISHIASLLKRSGHYVRLLVLDRKYGKFNYRSVDENIRDFSPELICFTSVNTEIEFIRNIAAYVKNHYPSVFLLLGGVHITLNPDEKFLETFNAFCIGEGEYPTLELAEKLSKKEDISGILNLWGREKGKIFKNHTRPYVNDLDILPFPDREMWQEWILEPDSRQAVLLGRGCPYNCTYCSNHKLRKISEGRYVRLRSPENIAEELLHIIQNDRPAEIFLEIETLGIDLKWLQSLCTAIGDFNRNRLKKASFSANLRIHDEMDFEFVFSNLKKANFSSITIGLESGSERIRREVLNRNYSNEAVISAVNTARKYGIKVGIFNLIGLPSETRAEFKETLTMNQLLQPDWHATSIFFPYEGTELYQVVKEMKLLPEKLDSGDERQHAVIGYPGFTRKQIQKSFDSFHYDVFKKSPGRSLMKLLLYFIQKFLGHNFMADAKNLLINLLSRFNIRSSSLLSIFQKSV